MAWKMDAATYARAFERPEGAYADRQVCWWLKGLGQDITDAGNRALRAGDMGAYHDAKVSLDAYRNAMGAAVDYERSKMDYARRVGDAYVLHAAGLLDQDGWRQAVRAADVDRSQAHNGAMQGCRTLLALDARYSGITMMDEPGRPPKDDGRSSEMHRKDVERWCGRLCSEFFGIDLSGDDPIDVTGHVADEAVLDPDAPGRLPRILGRDLMDRDVVPAGASQRARGLADAPDEDDAGDGMQVAL